MKQDDLRALFAITGLPGLMFAMLLGLLLGCTPSTTPPPTIDIDSIVAESEQLLDAQAYSSGLTTVANGLQQAPNHPDLLLARAQLYQAQHRWPEAEADYKQVLTHTATITPALELATVLLSQGKAVESRYYWQQVLDKNSDYGPAWLGLGNAYLAGGDYQAATEAYIQAQITGETDQVSWRLAALLLPTNQAAGRVYLQNPSTMPQRYLADTVGPFTEKTPQGEVARIVGIALIQLDQFQLAHHALSVAAELDPTNPQTWQFLGHAQAALNLPAMASFQQAYQLDPQSPLTPYFEGLYLRRQGLYDLAIERFLHALDLDPENVGVALETAHTLALQGDYQSAEAWYQSAVQAEPKSVNYQQFLTEFYINRGFRVAEQGLPAAERLVELAPDSPRGHDLLGWAKFQSGDLAGAQQALQTALRLDPNHVPAHYHLGKVLEAQNRHQEAEAAFIYVIDFDQSGAYRNRLLADRQ